MKNKKGDATMNQKKPKITLHVNNVITNDACALCREHCYPCGLDYFLGETKRLVCDLCAKIHAPEIVAARTAGLDFGNRNIEWCEADGQRKPAALHSNKGDLLEKYATRQPKQFVQYDGFLIKPENADSVMQPDTDGDCIVSSETWELMHGAPVRVLILPHISVTDVLRLLKKIATSLQDEHDQRKKTITEKALTVGEVAGVSETRIKDLPF